MLNVDDLLWDKHAQFGQNRPLQQHIIRYYVQRLLTQGEPVRPVEPLVKAMPNNKFLLLGGQHICGAIHWMRHKLLTQDRVKEPQLPASYRYVWAMVLDAATPLPMSPCGSGGALARHVHYLQSQDAGRLAGHAEERGRHA